MRSGSLAFLAGIFALQQFAELPDWGWCALLIPLSVLAWSWPAVRMPLWFTCGFFWALLRAQLLLAQGGLAPEYEGVDLIAEGTIASLPSQSEHDVRFLFDVDSLRLNDNVLPIPGRVRLSWRNSSAEVRVGDRWRFTVRLKRPSGYMNPGGFDYEGWLYQQGVRATGYVRVARTNAEADGDESAASPGYELLESAPFARPLDRWRQGLSEKISQTLFEQPHQAIIAALAIGVTQDFSEAQWDVLNRTGTTHMISISGLHIGFIAGVMFFLTRRVWAWSSQAALWWPAPKAAAVVALLAAAVYAALAGFSVPTQRSLVMVGVVMAAIIAQRRIPASRVLALSLLAVLLLDPLAVLQAGFWLSFGAVGVILFAMHARWGEPNWWWKWGRVQWVVAIGMLPLMLVLFQRTSMVAPLTNLVAVPWFNSVTVPLTLAGALTLPVSQSAGEFFLDWAQLSVVPVWWFLELAADTPWAQWTQHVPQTWTVMVGCIGTLWLLLPRGVPARWLGAVALAPMILVSPPAPQPGEFWFTLLDVGQGLSAVVRTANHVLVYDTGPKFSEHFNTGEAVVVPYLRYLGVRDVDILMLSHSDSDHIGGARSVLRQTKVAEVASSVPLELAPGATACSTPRAWQWDGVDFTVLYPPPVESGLRRKKDNDVSCVLRVSNAGGSVLLPGDIEIPSEKFLLANAAAQLRADILVVPHHGSMTSSSAEFVNSIAPHYALFPVGYRNRFGFPKAKVVQRYRDVDARMLDSANAGAISFQIGVDGVSAPVLFRTAARRYWHIATVQR
ncbi:MAG: DNA internalization-related competence protein ComEC/Rec2 [Gammaproteobacteria bacterium]|nr:DNA internalization-related competence protein ComEC/Rec2 [Gammaproteobacteria bacterium]